VIRITTSHPSRGLCVPALVLVVMSLSLLAAPATTNDQKWLKFFFDGVREKTSDTNTSAVVSTNKNQKANARAPFVPHGPAMVVHQPFGLGKCTECHGSGGMSPQPKMPLQQLCFSCHKDFIAGNKVKHQPVENGECTSCHAPHQGPNKFLLVKKGSELCLSCHDNPLAAGKVKHMAVEAGECLDCHTPHATNFKGLLKKSPKATCMECHDDIAKKKVVHQPVCDGDCMSCHKPHASNNKKLVIKTGAALCWECHESFLEKAKFTHDVVDDCMSCHDPHQSANGKLLKKEGNAVCFECHEDKDLKAVKGHVGAENKSCVVCHDPHAGQNKNLLKPAPKSPPPP
jgi:predicted CXXCH cytochrome family protein